MLEKEAKECFKKRYPNNITLNSYYVEGFNDGCNKANEWHKQEKQRLAEAKEIITALLNVFVYDLADDELDSGDIDVRDKAERFLKEVKENGKRL